MKHIFYGTIAGLFFSTLVAFAVVNYSPKRSTAEVKMMQGLYIFADATPVMEYDYLGSVKATIAIDGQYQNIRDKLIKKTVKDYPEANGIIIHFNAGGIDKADIIKIK